MSPSTRVAVASSFLARVSRCAPELPMSFLVKTEKGLYYYAVPNFIIQAGVQADFRACSVVKLGDDCAVYFTAFVLDPRAFAFLYVMRKSEDLWNRQYAFSAFAPPCDLMTKEYST